jgi:excinuclease UvrABC nuclease subunit
MKRRNKIKKIRKSIITIHYIDNSVNEREKLPEKPARYQLLNQKGEVVYTGSTSNLKRRIEEQSTNPDRHFSRVRVSNIDSEYKVMITKKIKLNKLKSSSPRFG